MVKRPCQPAEAAEPAAGHQAFCSACCQLKSSRHKRGLRRKATSIQSLKLRNLKGIGSFFARILLESFNSVNLLHCRIYRRIWHSAAIHYIAAFILRVRLCQQRHQYEMQISINMLPQSYAHELSLKARASLSRLIRPCYLSSPC